MAEKLKIASLGNGQTIVLLHGWGLNSGVWQPLAERLAQQFEVITVDLPGYGQNVDCVPNQYSIEQIASDIHDAVAQPAIYIGWSLGGLVATQIAIMFPASVTKLVTVASTPYFVTSDQWPGIEPNVLSLFHRQLEQDTQKTIDNFLKIQAMGSPHIRQDIKVIRDLVMQHSMPSKATLERSLQLLETVDLRPKIGAIASPMLRLYGKLDGLVPKAVIEQIDELAPASQSHVFTQSSHAPFISQLEEFSDYLAGWINEQR